MWKPTDPGTNSCVRRPHRKQSLQKKLARWERPRTQRSVHAVRQAGPASQWTMGNGEPHLAQASSSQIRHRTWPWIPVITSEPDSAVRLGRGDLRWLRDDQH